MVIELDGRQMHDRTSAHDYLQTQLGLPEYYGRNLDALYDILTERSESVTILVRYQTQLEAQLGRYAGALLATLRQASDKNPALNVQFE